MRELRRPRKPGGATLSRDEPTAENRTLTYTVVVVVMIGDRIRGSYVYVTAGATLVIALSLIATAIYGVNPDAIVTGITVCGVLLLVVGLALWARQARRAEARVAKIRARIEQLKVGR